MINVTYEIVTLESAQHADADERGFVDANDNQWELPAHVFGKAAAKIKNENAMYLRNAIELIGCVEDGGNGTDYYETDGRHDYQTGAEIRYALHLSDNITNASLARIRRLLIARHLLRA